jgi:predicted alpha/beta-fold hydrolase
MSTVNSVDDPFVGPRDLPAFGINFSRPHIYWLQKHDGFPPAIKLSARTRRWRRSAILSWIETRERAGVS